MYIFVMILVQVLLEVVPLLFLEFSILPGDIAYSLLKRGRERDIWLPRGLKVSSQTGTLRYFERVSASILCYAVPYLVCMGSPTSTRAVQTNPAEAARPQGPDEGCTAPSTSGWNDFPV